MRLHVSVPIVAALALAALLDACSPDPNEVDAGDVLAQEKTMEARTLDELLNLDDPAWPLVQEWIASATNTIEVLPTVEEERGAELLRVQVTTRSTMGAIVYETGGLLIDHGWIRVLGSGHPRLKRALGRWNEQQLGSVATPGYTLVADDVLGGVFALNSGALPAKTGSICYLEPETGECMDLDINYSGFLWWTLCGDVAKFYATERWEGWEEDVKALSGEQVFAFHPFLCTEGPPIGERYRSAVPLTEMMGLSLGSAD